jgi:hypothetical protein
MSDREAVPWRGVGLEFPQAPARTIVGALSRALVFGLGTTLGFMWIGWMTVSAWFAVAWILVVRSPPDAPARNAKGSCSSNGGAASE